ncbi:MAG: hypothetical protein LBD45_03520 [Bacteroidales bacterium]|jgi:hypothetical protein|nr:hypothetical protein [Bacteroidales bacterium]
MKILKLMDELKKIQTKTGKDLDVFVEMRSERGHCDFCVEHIEHDGIDEIVLIPNLVTMDKPAIVRIELWLDEFEVEEDYYWLNKHIDKNGHLIMDILVEDGQIVKWTPIKEFGDSLQFFYKAVDNGRYSLLNSNYKLITSLNGYVPNGCIPDKDGYGDYITLNIDNSTGKITNWYGADEISFKEFLKDR